MKWELVQKMDVVDFIEEMVNKAGKFLRNELDDEKRPLSIPFLNHSRRKMEVVFFL